MADVHRAQTTLCVKKIIADECNTSLVLGPPGYTSLVQPLDVAFNKEFKAVIERDQTKHMHANMHMELYASSTITAQDRQILITKWVGTAWSEVSAKKEVIIRAFKKCAISVHIDGSEDHDINIKGLDDYHVEPPEEDENAFILYPVSTSQK